MRSMWQRIRNEDQAQDLIEYSLLLAAMALFASGLMLNAGVSASGIWKSGNTQLAAANVVVTGIQPSSGGNGNGNGNGGNNNGNNGNHNGNNGGNNGNHNGNSQN